VQPVGGDQQRGPVLAVRAHHDHPARLRGDVGHPGARPHPAGPEVLEKDPVQVGAMQHHGGRAVAALQRVDARPRQPAPVGSPQPPDALSGAVLADRVAGPERVERAHGVRPQGQRRPDLAEAVRLLEDLDRPAGALERQPRGEAGDPRAGDDRMAGHASACSASGLPSIASTSG
jgi:hypothetical protein